MPDLNRHEYTIRSWSPPIASRIGGRLAKEFRDYAFSLTVIPKLASIDKYYESSSNWTANQRANSSEYYSLSYTDYRLVNHRLAANIMLGDSPSLALSDGYNLTPQFVVNVEAALHKTQQWRHFSVEKRNEVLSGLYPSSLYAQNDKKGYELAVGGQYTTDFLVCLALSTTIKAKATQNRHGESRLILLGY